MPTIEIVAMLDRSGVGRSPHLAELSLSVDRAERRAHLTANLDRLLEGDLRRGAPWQPHTNS